MSNSNNHKIYPQGAPNIHNKIINDIISVIEKSKKNNVSVLDLGTGRGYNLLKLKEYFEKKKIDYQFVGVDIDESSFMLEKNEKIFFQKKNLNEDFYFGKFDFVIATEVIEHLENPYHFLRNCLDNLKEDGFLYLSSPNVHNIFSLIKILLKDAPSFFSLSPDGKEHIMPTSIFLIKKILKTISQERNEFYDLKISFSQNILKIPIKKRGSFLHFVLPGECRLLGEVAIYKIKRIK